MGIGSIYGLSLKQAGTLPPCGEVFMCTGEVWFCEC
jgi:hypothetical protein